MTGILLYIYFLFIGFLYADMFFKDKDIYFRAWLGGVFGNVILMAGMIPFALIFKFTVVAHIALAVVSAAPYVILKIVRKDKLISIGLKGGEEYISHKIFLCVILPISIITWVLMTNHILAPFDGGGVSSGQCTYGDLQMHLSFVTSIAEQKDFPPVYPLLSGELLNYPFLVDMLSSSLYLFGASLRLAVLIPSYVISMLLVMGFYIVAYRVTEKKSASVLATVLFFINGGFGFAYFLEGAKADHSVFTRIFKDYYHTPTNYIDSSIRWVNTICDMIIPQRTTMAGWCTILPAIWLLLEGIKSKKRWVYIMLGILAGCMPMIHTHSFLALGMLSAVMFFVNIPSEKDDKKAYIQNWVLYGAIACIMAFPQLIMWTFRQTSGNESFLRFSFNWVNDKDTYFWFYLKNWGIIALFVIPAVIYAPKDNKKLMAAGAFIMLIAEFILFQPNTYDNNKLIFITYMIAVILVSDYLVYLYGKFKEVPGRNFFAAVIIMAGVFSGVLTIGREYVSGAQYQTFNADDIAMSEYIKKNTDAHEIFLTGGEVTNPVASLAGRTVYLGSSSYVHFHGFVDENAKRKVEVQQAYEGSYENMKRFCSDNNITYVFVGASENGSYKINQEMLGKLEKIYSKGGDSLYKVK